MICHNYPVGSPVTDECTECGHILMAHSRTLGCAVCLAADSMGAVRNNAPVVDTDSRFNQAALETRIRGLESTVDRFMNRVVELEHKVAGMDDPYTRYGRGTW